ncbi:MAG TPA: hypothetical protein VKR58_02225, partial [Aquella sp.]|nr:hypothetical protein [Aquella sp.]
YLFVLKEHLRWFMGKHYPKEIFEMILLRINIPVTLNYGIASSAIVKNPYYASSKKNMYAMLCLNKWVGDNFGNNYPRELVHMISTIAYKPIKIQCGWYWMKIFVANKIYSWDHESDFSMVRNKWDFKSSYEKQSIWDRKSPSELTWSIQYIFSNIPAPILIKKIKRYYMFILILLKSGKLYEYIIGIDFQISNKLINVTRFDCGMHHVVAISSDKIYVWGSNYHGQLGIGNDRECKYKPYELDLKLSDADYPRSVSCGNFHTILLTNAGHVYVWGYNKCGQLGLDDPMIYLPRKIEFKISMPKLIKTYARRDYSILVSDTNIIYFCGTLSYNDQNMFTEIRFE